MIDTTATEAPRDEPELFLPAAPEAEVPAAGYATRASVVADLARIVTHGAEVIAHSVKVAGDPAARTLAEARATLDAATVLAAGRLPRAARANPGRARRRAFDISAKPADCRHPANRLMDGTCMACGAKVR